MFNIIDHILIEDAVYDGEHGGGIIKARASLDKAYGRIKKGPDIDSEDFIPSGGSHLAVETEDGFAGFDPPLN